MKKTYQAMLLCSMVMWSFIGYAYAQDRSENKPDRVIPGGSGVEQTKKNLTEAVLNIRLKEIRMDLANNTKSFAQPVERRAGASSTKKTVLLDAPIVADGAEVFDNEEADVPGDELNDGTAFFDEGQELGSSQEADYDAAFLDYPVLEASGDLPGSSTEAYDPVDPSPGTKLHDQAVASFVISALADDQVVTRAEMLALFSRIETDGIVSKAEFADLKILVNNPPLFSMPDHVRSLASDLVNGSPWNATYQGHALGNLKAGSTADKLVKLVNKWFLGMDNPNGTDVINSRYTYQLASGNLFDDVSHMPKYTDINQGNINDCWLMASLAEVALRDTNAIKNMFIDNGDGTYTVQFFRRGKADYVTVDKQLPVFSGGNHKGQLIFGDLYTLPDNSKNVLWDNLAEKAFIEMQASWGSGTNSYRSIGGGKPRYSLSVIVGHAAKLYDLGVATFNFAVSAWNAGRLLTLSSNHYEKVSLGVLPKHTYAITEYNPLTNQFKLFNPWGLNIVGQVVDYFAEKWLSWRQIASNFDGLTAVGA